MSCQAWKLFEEQNLIAIIDKRLKHTSLDEDAIIRVINVALACIQLKAASRPKMHEVGHMLLGNMPINKLQSDHRSVTLSDNVGHDATAYWENNTVSTDEMSSTNNLPEIELCRS